MENTENELKKVIDNAMKISDTLSKNEYDQFAKITILLYKALQLLQK